MLTEWDDLYCIHVQLAENLHSHSYQSIALALSQSAKASAEYSVKCIFFTKLASIGKFRRKKCFQLDLFYDMKFLLWLYSLIISVDLGKREEIPKK